MAIEYRVLGLLEVRSDGQRIELSGKKQRLLLSMLLAYANQRVSFDRLIDGIWGNQQVDRTSHTLRVHVSNLRKLLEPDHQRGQAWTVIETVEEGYRLRVDHDSFDRDQFEGLAEKGRRLLEKGDGPAAASTLREALGLWRAAAFGELASEAALEAEATRLEELRLATIEDRVEVDLRLGHHHEVIAELRDLIDLHPFRERLRGLLMLALYRAGRQAEALRAYRSLERALGDELGIEPSPEIRDLEQRILLQDPSLDLVLARPAPVNNLPAATTSFVGREQDVARVHELLTTTRLLTFTGSGGVGKTRLALEAAAPVADQFSDGVWLVQLAPLRDPSLLDQAVAEVLQIDQHPDRSAEATLAERLRNRSVLLILDNCEHLIEGTATLADTLLQACPELRVWATSRERLGIAGETQFLVSGLPTPDDPDLRHESLLAGYDAVRLFVDRASAAHAGFELDSDNAPSVVQICRRLDGIPLAIELAAARVTFLSPHQIAAGLDDRFELLTTGSRTAEARQQTLGATVDWSYDLLTEPEQALLRRLSVFRGTFDLKAAEAVCQVIKGSKINTLNLLCQLVTKSLVVASPVVTEVRYELLETIRLYAWAKLAAAGEEEEALLQHRAWFLGLAEEAGPELRGTDQLRWLQRLEADHDNLRAVLERSQDAGDVDTSLRIAGSIAWFWFLHSHLAEGWNWLERVIAQSHEAADILRVRVLIAAGQFAWEQSKDEKARDWLEEALRLARQIESRTHTGWALAYLALVATLESRWEDGERLAGEALELFQATGNLGGVGFSLWVEASASYLKTRDQGALASAVELVQRIEALLDAAQQIGDRNFTGHLLWSLAIAAHDRGDYSVAERYLPEALRAFRELGNKSCTGHTLDQFAWLALAQGKPKRAARLLAATEALRSRLGIPGHLFEQRSWEECRQRVAGVLDTSEFDESWSDGQHMDLDQAINYGLGHVSSSPTG